MWDGPARRGQAGVPPVKHHGQIERVDGRRQTVSDVRLLDSASAFLLISVSRFNVFGPFWRRQFISQG